METASAPAQFDRAGRHLTVYLSGDVDVAVAKAIGDAVLDRHRPDDERVWLDMGAVTFCDSSGVGMLFRLHHAIEAHGTVFVVYDPPPIVRSVLALADPSNTLKLRTGARWPVTEPEDDLRALRPGPPAR